MAIFVETRSRVSESVLGIVTFPFTFYATTVLGVHVVLVHICHVAGCTVATPPESVCIPVPVPGTTIIDRHSHFPLFLVVTITTLAKT